MAAALLPLTALFLLFLLHTRAQTMKTTLVPAPFSPVNLTGILDKTLITTLVPAPSGPINITGILDKNGQFTTFIRLLILTQVADQINNQLNSSAEGMSGITVFAPTDNAFNDLKAGTLNALSIQELVQVVLYHVLPKFYTLSNLLLVRNPVRTQATGQEGGVFGLNFTGHGNQVNVSSGIVETQVNSALIRVFPLAVYQVDKVLLPEELFGVKEVFGVKAPSGATPSGAAPSAVPSAAPSGAAPSGAAPSAVPSAAPSAAPLPLAKTSSDGLENTTMVASQPSTTNGSAGSRVKSVGLGFVIGGLICMGIFS